MSYRERLGVSVAWFRRMGVDEVAYHRATVVGRDDDHPGRALDYYGSRGETPLRWGGDGAARLGLSGEVTAEGYEAAFGPGGFVDPATGQRLVRTTRPEFELVVASHKSVAVLGVVGEAEAMHSILDAETAATMEWLEGWFGARGGRRGRCQGRSATGGLVYAMTRLGTSRAGDPAPDDHVLVANVVEMADLAGGFKGLDSAALRDTTEAATMVGRLLGAAAAVRAGFAIEPDVGPSGNLRRPSRPAARPAGASSPSMTSCGPRPRACGSWATTRQSHVHPHRPRRRRHRLPQRLPQRRPFRRRAHRAPRRVRRP